MQIVALVVGATGIAGRGVSQELIDARRQSLRAFAQARRPRAGRDPCRGRPDERRQRQEGARRAEADPRLSDDLVAPGDRRGEHQGQRRRGADAARRASRPPARCVHVALVTGLKHYLGPFDAYVKAGTLPLMPVREEQPRLDIPNFYYAQEDEVYAAAARDGFTWSVHRPHTIIGKAIGNAMNMGSTLAAYASICKETGRKFKFPGSAAQWNGLSRHDRRPDPRQAARLGEHERFRQEQRLQHRQRRHLPLELDVAAAREMVRRRVGRLHRRGDAARSADGRRRARSGSASPRSTGSSSPTSRASPRPGTPTSISAGRSK